MNLRDYQIQGRVAIREAYQQGHRRVLYVLPTGGGKTVTFCDMAVSAVERGRRVFVGAHRQEIVRQISTKLEGHEHGMVCAGTRPAPFISLQVGMIQTLSKRLDKYMEFDFIIIDEAHHTTASTYMKILEAYPFAHVLGVTATPCRTDGTGLRDAGFSAMVLGPTVAELTARGYLTPAKVYAPPGIDTSGVKRTGGDYNKKALAAVADRPKITGDAIAHYRQFCDGQPAIAFCVSVEHAEHVAAEFCAAGYRAASIDGRMKPAERLELVAALGDGRLHVLTSCEILGEGVDVPVVVCGIMLRPTQSLSLWIQQMGRTLRPAPGKTHAVILDHAGNTARHGLPTTPRAWSLDSERQTRKKPADPDDISVRICTECFMAHESRPVCPYCGYIYPLQPRVVEQVDGDLILLDEAYEKAGRRLEERRCESLADWQALAAERGYKPGWALRRWQLRQNKRKVTA